MEENNGFGAQWLRPLLEANYFIPCRDHGEEMSKSECKYFCLDCMGKSICSYYLIHHREHRIVQIIRSNYHNIIRVNEVQKHIDISGVQHYVINNAEIVFLNECPQLIHGKRVTCEICVRTLLDSFRFCSLGCKGSSGTYFKFIRLCKYNTQNAYEIKLPNSHNYLYQLKPDMDNEIKICDM
ncbi:hypothetical protein MKX03_026415 [Papaver bracteatum]|nr:hypothetical protein MKX03_026415 [Papaver bracteatum]